MVADTLPEQSSVVSDGDAGIAPVTDAAPEEVVVDAAEVDVDSFLSGRKEGDGGATESGTVADTEIPELKEAREAAAKAAGEKAEQEAQVRIEQERAVAEARVAKERADAEYRQHYRKTAEDAGVEAYNLAVEAGYPEAEARARQETAIQRVNSLHARGLRLYEAEATAQAGSALVKNFNDGVWEALGSQALRDAYFKGKYPTPQEAVKGLIDVARQGYITESESVAREKAGILAYRRDLEKKYPGVFGSESGSRVSGSAAGGSFSSEGDLNRAFNDGKITRETYAREHKRITGREP